MSADSPCPIPVDEPQRLEAIRAYEIFDTEPELEFDALTRVASHTFGAPIAVVAMMDSDRLWFKSKLGLDVPQLDRKIAFCAHAIMHPHEPLVVEDLLQDPRFCDNPLVVGEPRIRFYAGAPIVDPGGHALGTIAVIDAQPRAFSAHERDTLKDLSTLVMTALQGRRRAIELQRLAMTDYLTGIGNRAQFDRALVAELGHAQRSALACTVLCMDLDGFKEVNDSLGHAAGDEVLTEVARRLGRLVRVGDTLARMGGDEFGVVMRHGSKEAAAALAQRIVKTVGKPIQLSTGEEASVTISVGMATYSSAATSASVLLAQADRALYHAKNRAAQ